MAAEQQPLELIAVHQEGVLAAVTRNGYPHLTNVLYLWDADERTAGVSTTADRVKGSILTRDRLLESFQWKACLRVQCDDDVVAAA